MEHSANFCHQCYHYRVCRLILSTVHVAPFLPSLLPWIYLWLLGLFDLDTMESVFIGCLRVWPQCPFVVPALWQLMFFSILSPDSLLSGTKYQLNVNAIDKQGRERFGCARYFQLLVLGVVFIFAFKLPTRPLITSPWLTLCWVLLLFFSLLPVFESS